MLSGILPMPYCLVTIPDRPFSTKDSLGIIT